MNLAVINHQAKRLIVVLIPMLLFAVIYDSMRYYPNYLFNDIDVEGVYRLECMLFGVESPDGIITPCEFFNQNNTPILDFLSGVFYLLWVPLPVVFGLYLFFTGRRRIAFEFYTAFLIVNIVGFCGYYIHPSSPPWYVINYGFEPVLNTPGNVGGFARFDDLIGFPLFHSIYGKNANVFAAIPSLHSAYNPIALYYACKVWKADKKTRFGTTKPSIIGISLWIVVLTLVSVGIWWAAVYSTHHYIIDVILGIITTIVGIALVEGVIFRLHAIDTSITQISDWLNS